MSLFAVRLDRFFARPYARLFHSEAILKTFRRLLKRTPFYGAYKAAGHYPDYWYWILRGRPERLTSLLEGFVRMALVIR